MLNEFFKQIIFLVLIIIATDAFASNPVAPVENVNFFSVADIHFDPYSGCEKSSKNCELLNKLQASNYQDWSVLFEKYGDKTISNVYHDANYPLLKSALHELIVLKEKQHPKFVIILGDFLAHDFREKYIKYSGDKSYSHYQAFVKKTLQYLTYEFENIFPDIDVYPVVGNNDSYTGDYDSVPGGQFFHDMRGIWSVLIKNKANKERFKNEFPIAGYYEVTLPNSKNQRLIILNSVLFSSRVHKKLIQKTAVEELNWMQKKLQNAEEHHEQVLLADHIPVGIDPYATIKTDFTKIQQFWKPIYSKQFENILSQYPFLITAILSGHIHTDTFQLITMNKIAQIPVYITPSISPKYGNSPGFKIFHYNPTTLQLRKINTYYFPLDEAMEKNWKRE